MPRRILLLWTWSSLLRHPLRQTCRRKSVYSWIHPCLNSIPWDACLSSGECEWNHSTVLVNLRCDIVYCCKELGCVWYLDNQCLHHTCSHTVLLCVEYSCKVGTIKCSDCCMANLCIRLGQEDECCKDWNWVAAKQLCKSVWPTKDSVDSPCRKIVWLATTMLHIALLKSPGTGIVAI